MHAILCDAWVKIPSIGLGKCGKYLGSKKNQGIESDGSAGKMCCAAALGDDFFTLEVRGGG